MLWKSHTKAAEKRLQPIASVLRNDLLHGGYGAFDHAVVPGSFVETRCIQRPGAGRHAYDPVVVSAGIFDEFIA